MTLVAFWFLVLTVLWAGFFLLEGFDLGVGMLHGVVGHDEAGRRAVIGTIGPLWDGNEVWLIVATAGTFAAFPGWYATMFSAFYPVVLVVLVGLILRGVSFEFRSHAGTDRSRRLWGAALLTGSAVIPFGLGIMLGGLLGGVPIDADQEFTGNLGDLLAPYALATGLTLTLLCLLHGAVFLRMRTAGQLHARAVSVARALAPATALAVIGWCTWTRVVSSNGFLLSVVELAAALAAVTAAVLVRTGSDGGAFAATAATVVAVVVSLFAELYPRVMVSSLGSANDLTAKNTASASYSLTVMTVVVAVVLPVVLLYQAWTYHVFRGRVRGPRVGGDDPGPAVPAPRPAPAPAPAPTEPAGTAQPTATEPALPPDTARPMGRTRRRPAGWLAVVALVVLATGLLVRQVLLGRTRPG
jgi:cytochrome d ubiquinol oxidase subunit II